MAEPPGSAAALADQIGSTYQREDDLNGLSTWPPLVLVVVELLEDELLDELEELLLEELVELLLEDEVELLLELDELEVPLLEDELELLLELELLEVPPRMIVPAEGVSVTRSSRAPSSRRLIRSVCVPAARLLKTGSVRVA